MRVLVAGDYKMFKKPVNPGMGTFATEITQRLKNYVDVDYFTYKNTLQNTALKIFGKGYISNNKYDIIHDLSGTSYLNIKKIHRYKFITTVHDFHIAMFSYRLTTNQQKFNFKHFIWLNLVKKALLNNINNADDVIVVSSLLKELAIDLFDIEAEKLHIVNHGVSTDLKPLYNKKDKFIIGTLSELTPRKNPIMLINAFNIFTEMLDRSEQKDVWLNLYGNYTKETEKFLKKSIRKLKNVKFRGVVKQSKKPEIYNSFNVFAFPSIEEGFGMPILEAEACGIPVVLNSNGMIPKEVKKYCYGAHSSEEMADIFYNFYTGRYNKNKILNNIKYAQSFTWERAASKLYEIYKS